MRFQLLITALMNCLAMKAQEIDNSADREHTHEHAHHRNEIGVANAPVYFIKGKEISYGLHIHYIRNIKQTKFGVGAGIERIFDRHGHNTFGLVAGYNPIEKLGFILSPGITFEDENPANPQFALHVETAYEFEIKNFHLGPVLEFAYDPEDFHLSLGIHVGIGFPLRK